MELVRLYYNSMDVRPSVLVRHFVRYLGLYVEENIEKGKMNSHSLTDIYLRIKIQIWKFRTKTEQF